MTRRDKRVLSKDSKVLQQEINDLIIADIDKKLKEEFRKLRSLQRLKISLVKNKIMTSKFKDKDFIIDLS